MKLVFKQRFLSWFDSYDIYDEYGNTVFTIKGELSWGHLLRIFDSNGNEIAMLKQKILTFLPSYIVCQNGVEIGSIEKEFSLLKPKYHLTFNDWIITGSFLQYEYDVKDSSGNLIMQLRKRILNFTDTYELEIFDNNNILTCLMIVLAIDIDNCSNND